MTEKEVGKFIEQIIESGKQRIFMDEYRRQRMKAEKNNIWNFNKDIDLSIFERSFLATDNPKLLLQQL